jgi:hypothetical protein
VVLRNALIFRNMSNLISSGTISHINRVHSRKTYPQMRSIHTKSFIFNLFRYSVEIWIPLSAQFFYVLSEQKQKKKKKKKRRGGGPNVKVDTYLKLNH